MVMTNNDEVTYVHVWVCVGGGSCRTITWESSATIWWLGGNCSSPATSSPNQRLSNSFQCSSATNWSERWSTMMVGWSQRSLLERSQEHKVILQWFPQ